MRLQTSHKYCCLFLQQNARCQRCPLHNFACHVRQGQVKHLRTEVLTNKLPGLIQCCRAQEILNTTETCQQAPQNPRQTPVLSSLALANKDFGPSPLVRLCCSKGTFAKLCFDTRLTAAQETSLAMASLVSGRPQRPAAAKQIDSHLV